MDLFFFAVCVKLGFKCNFIAVVFRKRLAVHLFTTSYKFLFCKGNKKARIDLRRLLRNSWAKSLLENPTQSEILQ
jgi:hypothetical protein